MEQDVRLQLLFDNILRNKNDTQTSSVEVVDNNVVSNDLRNNDRERNIGLITKLRLPYPLESYVNTQKQPPEVFSKKRCSSKFRKIHKKKPVSDLFIIKLQASASNFIKKRLTQVFPCEFCEISKNTLFTEHFGATASKQILSHTNTCNKALEKNVSGCRKII